MFVKKFRRLDVRDYAPDLISSSNLKVEIETIGLHITYNQPNRFHRPQRCLHGKSQPSM